MDNIEKLGIEFLKECIDVDFDTGCVFWKKRPLSHFKDERIMNWWNTRYAGKKAGSIHKLKNSNTNYYLIGLKNKLYQLHRIIFFMFNGYIIDGDRNMIDHIDRNGLNNSISNLRLVTRSENLNNCGVRKKEINKRKKYKTNTSGIPGIHFDKSQNKWAVRITINKKRKCIGYYNTIEEAKIALKEAKIKYNLI